MKITEDWEELPQRHTVAGAAKYLCQKLAAKFGLKGNNSSNQTTVWPDDNGAGNWPAAKSEDNSFLVSVDESTDTISKIIIH